jgi:hypothetical protein
MRKVDHTIVHFQFLTIVGLNFELAIKQVNAIIYIYMGKGYFYYLLTTSFALDFSIIMIGLSDCI